MSKGVLVAGGAAVLSLLIAGSVVAANPKPQPAVKLAQVGVHAPTPAYLASVHGEGRDVVLVSLGINKVKRVDNQAVAVEDAQTTRNARASKIPAQVPEKLVVAQAEEVKIQRQNRIQTASRSLGDNVSPGLIEYALSLRGIPYSFGGSTTAGFDCSGYTQYVYRKFGVWLPRDSYSQFRTGRRVQQGNLQPGDLVFFSTYTSGASHVGIYMGNGMFIDSSNSGVSTHSLSQEYWRRRYVGARRVN